MASSFVLDYEGAFRFDPDPATVWSELERFDEYERWWRWLRDFDVDGDGLRAGTVLRGVVRPPLPYRMRLTVELLDADRPRCLEAAVHGDLEGRASLRLEADGDGTVARVSWSIEMQQGSMRAAARVARHVLAWGHDRVVEMTVGGFRRRLDHQS